MPYPLQTCPQCGGTFGHLRAHACDCGQYEVCPECWDAVPRNHRDGDCGLDDGFAETVLLLLLAFLIAVVAGIMIYVFVIRGIVPHG